MVKKSGTHQPKWLDYLIKLGPPSAGSLITVQQVHEILESEHENIWEGLSVVAICIGATVALTLFVRFVNQVYVIAAPETENFATWLTRNFINLLKKFFQEDLPSHIQRFTSKFQQKYFDSLVQTYRLYQTKGLKISGPVALELEKVFIPLKVAPQVLQDIAPEIIPDDDQTLKTQRTTAIRGQEIWDFIADIAEDPDDITSRRIALLGPPGSGKTTILQHITLSYAKGEPPYTKRKLPKLVPVLLYLRDIRNFLATSHPPDLAEIIGQQDRVIARILYPMYLTS